MKNRKQVPVFYGLMLLIITSVTLPGCFIDDLKFWEEKKTNVSCTRTCMDPHPKESEWTIMVYLDADNNLENFALEDIQEMKDGIIDNQGINLIVLIDRIYGSFGSLPEHYALGETFTGTRLYRVTSGSVSRLSDNTFLGLSCFCDNDELNMGDPDTLKNFIRFGKTVYPANHYALVLWNHGIGPRKKGTENSNIDRSICEDITSGGDMLYTAEISDVLSIEDSVDLLGFDACDMGSVEIAYQYRPGNGSFYAEYMVASPAEEWGPGWKYDAILSRLRSGGGNNGEVDTIVGNDSEFELYYNPSNLTSEEFGGIIVEEQYDSTKNDIYWKSSQTLSLYNLSMVGAVKAAVDSFSQQLASEGSDGEKGDMESIRGSGGSPLVMHYFNPLSIVEVSGGYGSAWIPYAYFDLYDLAERAEGSGLISFTSRSLAGNVKTAVDNMVLYSFGGSDYSGFTPGKHGLYIFFPDGDREDSGNPRHWTYQYWYNANFTGNYSSSYGKLSWCIDGAHAAVNDVGNWFELLDSWFDDPLVDDGGYNNYQW